MAKSSSASPNNGADVIRRTFLNRLFSGNILLSLILLTVLFSLTSVDVHALTAPHTDYQPVSITVQRSTNCFSVTYGGIDNVIKVGSITGPAGNQLQGTYEVAVNVSNALATLGIEIADIQSIGLNTCPDSAGPVKTYNYTLGRWIYAGEFDAVGGSLADYISPTNEMRFGFETFSTHLVNGVNVIPQFSAYLGDFEIAVTHLVPVGHVTATLEPEAVNSLGATWSITNMDEFVSDCTFFGPIDYTSYNSGDYVTNLKVGNYRVSFGSVQGWNTPQAQDIVINEGSTTSVTAQYTMKLGAIQGFIFPAGAGAAGAQWSVDGGNWQSSGDTVTNLQIGAHVVSYKPVFGWEAPADLPVTVYENQTASAAGTYVQQFGSLNVTLSPSGAISAGAQWQLDGGAWQNSGVTISNIVIGNHTIAFNPISGWDTPTSQPVTINANLTTSATGIYVQQVGTVTVNITPAGAIAAGAQWQMDGGAWRSSGATLSTIPIGDHTIAFKSISGWDTPASQLIQVQTGQTASVTSNYVQQVGSLRVDIAPSQAVSAGAQWTIDNGAWNNGGATVSGLSPGYHTISYKTISGWDTPGPVLVQIVRDTTATGFGVYVQQVGSVSVALAPAEAVAAGARWRLDGGAWQNSGATLSNIPIGNHSITFDSVPGWNSPSSKVVQVTKNANTGASGTYVQLVGAVSVSIAPSEAARVIPSDGGNVGAQWRLDGGAWQDNGTTLSGIAVGSHSVTFKTIPGWDTPASQNVTVSEGSTTTATGIYVQQIGALSVTIVPSAAVASGAQWQVDGGGWQNSGASVSGLAVGNHTIAFKPVSGWDTPTSENVEVTQNSTSTAIGTYTPQVGSLSVTITPSAAVASGAQWQVDGGGWQNSGASVSGLVVGNHAIAFKSVGGWDTPASQNVEVTPNSTSTATGTYVKQTGATKVDITPSAAISAGAQWKVDGGAWRNSGETVSDLDLGSHTISFRVIAGWTAPEDRQITIANGVTTSVDGAYIVRNTQVDPPSSGGGGGGGGGCFITSLIR